MCRRVLSEPQIGECYASFICLVCLNSFLHTLFLLVALSTVLLYCVFLGLLLYILALVLLEMLHLPRITEPGLFFAITYVSRYYSENSLNERLQQNLTARVTGAFL